MKQFVIREDQGAYAIQKEIRTLLSFRGIEEWENYLHDKGMAHNKFYHYTSLKTLKQILVSSRWRLRRADTSNDSKERPVHNASFTVGQLSSMGMWKQYSGAPDDIGVRIGIPKKTFFEIFTAGKVDKKNADDSYDSIPVVSNVTITDVAYWYFGTSGDGDKDVVFYKGYTLPFNAFGTYAPGTLEKTARNSRGIWERPDPTRKLPPCFKDAIWRSEEETRVVYYFHDLDGVSAHGNTPCDIPDDVYVKIKPEHFRNMDFRLAPGIAPDKVAFGVSKNSGLTELLVRFGLEVLIGDKIRAEQFHLASEQENYQPEA